MFVAGSFHGRYASPYRGHHDNHAYTTATCAAPTNQHRVDLPRLRATSLAWPWRCSCTAQAETDAQKEGVKEHDEAVAMLDAVSREDTHGENK